MKPLLTVAIVGLQNVGKSTLFNRILGQKVAIVDSSPGVTRDRIRSETDWSGTHFVLIDTGGMVDPSVGHIERAVMQQIDVALNEADLILFVVDGKGGPNPVEGEIAERLRKSEQTVLLVANKVDNPASTAHYEHTKLGLGMPIPISAANGTGIGDLLDAIVEKLPLRPVPQRTREQIRIAVMGRPNAGKSSFVNRLLGEERVIVAETPGTTRDSVDSTLRFEGKEVVIVDTAGLKKKSRVTDRIDFYASRRVISSMERSDVVAVLLDPTTGIGKQDFKIAELAEDRGKGLLFIVTKWDLVTDREEQAGNLENEIRREAAGFWYVPIIFISSVSGLRVRAALERLLEIHHERRKRIPTATLNEALTAISREHQPPQIRGKVVKILYGSQVAVSPPRFVLFATAPQFIQQNYRKFIVKKLRERFGFEGVPIILSIRGRRRRE
jgi:GTP-binding protein